MIFKPTVIMSEKMAKGGAVFALFTKSGYCAKQLTTFWADDIAANSWLLEVYNLSFFAYRCNKVSQSQQDANLR